VFIERLWRLLKHEVVCLTDDADGCEASSASLHGSFSATTCIPSGARLRDVGLSLGRSTWLSEKSAIASPDGQMAKAACPLGAPHGTMG
jgi:hypothetical protein